MRESIDMPTYLKVSVTRACSSHRPVSHTASKRVNIPTKPQNWLSIGEYIPRKDPKIVGRRVFPRLMTTKSYDFTLDEKSQVKFQKCRLTCHDIDNSSKLRSMQSFNVNRNSDFKTYVATEVKQVKLKNPINNEERSLEVIEPKIKRIVEFNYK